MPAPLSSKPFNGLTEAEAEQTLVCDAHPDCDWSGPMAETVEVDTLICCPKCKSAVTTARGLSTQEYRAVWRVLRLVDGYLSEMPQETLHGHGGGFMTIAELRQHVQGALGLLE
jgi:hypothetical protein